MAHGMNIVIADDHDIFRQSLAYLINNRSDHTVIDHAASFTELLELLDRIDTDCVLLDYHMPGGNPLQAAAKLKRHRNPPRIIMLTGSQSCSVMKQLSESAADGVLHKRDNADTIMNAINSVAAGERYISTMVAGMIESVDVNLTQRELQVLELLLKGHCPIQIAQTLTISPRTVEKHKENMMKKVGAANSMELIEAGHRLVVCE